MTINELITKAHQNAKDKGFWSTERNTGELLMLIVSECGEALEAHRKDIRADLVRFDRQREDQYYKDNPAIAWERDFPKWFKLYIKDTFEDELADIVIRIADFLGGIPIRGQVEKELASFTNGDPWEEFPGDELPENVGECLLEVTICVTDSWKKSWVSPDYVGQLLAAMCAVRGIAKAMDIDLIRHIKLKMSYNSSREYLHGKKY